MISDILQAKIEKAYEVLRLAVRMSKLYYQAPLICTYSGGKDSDVLAQLALECLDPSDFEIMNSHTSVDAPETVYYIRERFAELTQKGVKTTIHIPRYADGTQKTMWNLIVKHCLPPTRLMRYCCQDLKETTTPNRYVATGVRADESTNRAGRDSFGFRGSRKVDRRYYSLDHVAEVLDSAERERERVGGKPNDADVYDCFFIEMAKKKKDLICQPIYEWTNADVWDFIRDRGMRYNPLYDKGYSRVGCVGCPLSSEKLKEFRDYPKYKENYIRAFDRMVEERKRKGKHLDSKYTTLWTDGEAVFAWWIEDKQIPGQLEFDLDGNIKEHKA